MAAVLQHQIEGRVNDLYFKLASHAKIIMTLSVELDRLKAENQDMKGVIKQNRNAIRQILREQEESVSVGGDSDIRTSESKETTNDFFKINNSEQED
jgi:hypothetical protein